MLFRSLLPVFHVEVVPHSEPTIDLNLPPLSLIATRPKNIHVVNISSGLACEVFLRHTFDRLVEGGFVDTMPLAARACGELLF